MDRPNRLSRPCVPWTLKHRFEVVIVCRRIFECLVGSAFGRRSHTTRPGGGKIFISDVGKAVRIESGERDDLCV